MIALAAISLVRLVNARFSLSLHRRPQVEGDGEWLGFGLSADGSMPSGGAGSDITVSWVDDSSCTGGCAKDYWATQYNMPTLDTIQVRASARVCVL